MSRRTLLACHVAIVIGSLVVLGCGRRGSTSRQAETQDTVPEKLGPGVKPSCMTLLTDAEVRNVTKRTPSTTTKETENRTEGDTDCQWKWDEESLLDFSFKDAGAIKIFDEYRTQADGTPWAPTVSNYFDQMVKVQKDNHLAPLEAVTGIGQRAVLIEYGISKQLFIERVDGIGFVHGINMPRDQVLALGGLVAGK